jgi:hypothetical protein
LEYLGLHNKPKAEVHPGHKLTSPKEEKEEDLKQVCDLENLNEGQDIKWSWENTKENTKT